MKHYSADFETTKDPDDCRVWLYGLCDIDAPDDFSYGTSIDHFVGIVSTHDSVVFFHNLKFDGIFIIDWLFREGYVYSDRPKPGEFSTLISKHGMFYQIHVKWKNGRSSEFRDSLKKLPMSVEKIAESFGLDVQKGDIDHTIHRPKGHVPTAEEIDYVKKDVVIVAKALAEQFEVGGKRLTIGADALADYKKMSGSVFRVRFPVLPVDVDGVIRAAYRGGWTYLKHGFELVHCGHGKVYDVNSLYPYVMRERELPYGFPEYFEGPPQYRFDKPLWVASLTFTAKLYDRKLPTIQVKKGFHFASVDYKKEIEEPTTLCITNVDYRLWVEHYDVDELAWNGGYYFSARRGFFDEYIDKWMEVKKNSEGGKRETAKLFLNSLYGKYATNPDITGKHPEYVDGIVRLVPSATESREPVYTPIGVFVTAYAREITVKAAQDNYDTFVYADTDSLHLVTEDEPKNLDVDQTALGKWKLEYEFTEAIYARPKAYSEKKTTGEWETRIAGLPRKVSKTLTASDLIPGSQWSGKLTPKIVPGGVVLIETTYTFRV